MTISPGPPVDVLIHVADGVVYEGLDYAARIEERLSAAGLTSARCALTAAPCGSAPAARAHVLTGGATSAASSEPWMLDAVGAARRLVDGAGRGEFSVVGICLGSQILAQALRPGSIVTADGIEVGLTTVTRPGEPRAEQVVPSFHYESISPEFLSLPGINVEWQNAHTTVQAFSCGARAFGCQFHPELSAADVHRLIDHHSAEIARTGGDVAAAHRSVDTRGAALSADLFLRTVVDRLFGAR